MDELEKRFFSSPEIFGKAIELLSRYKNIEHLPWNQVEELLIDLEEGEAELLEKAIEFKKVQNHELNRLTAEVEFLKETVKSLSSQSHKTVSTLPEPILAQESSTDNDDDLPINVIAC